MNGERLMTPKFSLPKKKAVIFWPVGTADSTTLILRPNDIVMQIDLHHMAKADDHDETEWPIIDHLVEILPKRNGKPYLALFVLTHPDQDHIKGFKELLQKVQIGELWHTPRIFRDQTNQETLCEDAKAFRQEARRRRNAILAKPNSVQSGDRLRIIGHDDILTEEKYIKLPGNCKSRPGEIVSVVDENNLKGHFEAFIHAPFKDDQAKDKNNTSVALNIVLFEDGQYGQFMFFGDREYTTIKRIFEATEKGQTNQRYLDWNVMLSAHHCSKAVMYYKDESDSEESLKQDIMDIFDKYSRPNASYIIASSSSNFTDGEGDNPPHRKARHQYEKLVKAGRFICTHEYPSKSSPAPLVFTVDGNGFSFDDQRKSTQGPAGLAAAVAAARGHVAPPNKQTTFGHV